MSLMTLNADLDAIKKRLPSDKLARTVMARAINRAIVAGRTTAAREGAKRYALRQRQINELARTGKATAANPEAVLEFKGGALNITDYKVSPGKPQPAKRPVLRVTIGKGSGAKRAPGAFLIATRSGTVQGFKRMTGDRYPIRPVFAPSVPQVLSSEGLRESVQERMQEVIYTRLDHEIQRELDKGGR